MKLSINEKFEDILRGTRPEVFCSYCGCIDRYPVRSRPGKVTVHSLRCTRCRMKIRVKL